MSLVDTATQTLKVAQQYRSFVVNLQYMLHFICPTSQINNVLSSRIQPVCTKTNPGRLGASNKKNELKK